MPKSLVEKVCEACKGVDTILKQGDNGEYAYLRILDIANALRERLFASGVLIIPNDVECVVERFESETPNRPRTQARVATKFTVTDGVQAYEYISVGFACDMDSKCVAIAQTAALKSFLKRLAMIFGEWDDPEVAPTRGWKSKEEVKAEQKQAQEINRQRQAEWDVAHPEGKREVPSD